MIERAKIQSILDELKNNSRIDEAYCAKLDKSFEAETLYIGVVGKMKAGKSSLLNAVIFEDNILPTGMRPVTVTLTEIAFGEKSGAVVELMSKQDIEDLKEKASYSGNDANLCSKADAAKDTLNSLPIGYEKYLGLPVQNIELDELKKYVDADGECSGLAKSVKVYLKNDKLKGITIIDTPGFNDPVTSRGETTKEALSKCHVLLFVHNKDGYDATDVELLTEQIAYAGISEIVDVLNKVDMLGEPNEWSDELEYFIQKRNDLIVSNETIKNLLNNSHATYVSSLMALCGLIPYDRMTDDMKYQYSGFEEDFEELCQFTSKEEQQKAFVKYSNVSSIVNEINRLSKEGSSYLVEGPVMTLRGKLLSVKETIMAEIEEKKAALNSLNVSIEANRKSLENFEDFMSSVMAKVKVSSLEVVLSDLINQAVTDIQRLRTSECNAELTEKHYPDPGFGSTGVTKANVANYNTFVSGFENMVRDRLNNLKDSFNSACKKEINSLILSLSDTALIDKEHMDNLNKSLFNNMIKSNSETITVIVDSKRIDGMPDGKQKQWDRLRGRFLHDYDDERICNLEKGLLESFKHAKDNLEYVSDAVNQLDELKRKIESSLKKSPSQKKMEVLGLEKEIQNLSDEQKSIEAKICIIDDLKKNLNNN